MRFSSLLRLHRSTFVLIAVSLMVGVVANLGGDYHPPDVVTKINSIDFGWPCVYGQAVSHKSGSPIILSLWNHTQINEWHFGGLLIDLVVLLLIVGAVAAIWEWRRRKIKHLLQFTLADVFLGSLLVAGFYGFERYLCRDMFTERELRLTYQNPWSLDVNGQQMGVAEGSYSLNQDVPADWFWEFFRVPHTHRPYRRLRLRVQDNRGRQLTAKQEELLGRLRNVREVSFWCGISDGKVFNHWSQLQSLTFPYPNDQILTSLPELPHLHALRLGTGKFSDVGLLSLSRQPALRELFLFMCEIQGGSTFERLTTVEELGLQQVSLEQTGLDALSKMPALRDLEIQLMIDLKVPVLDWGSLSRSPQLRNLVISPALTMATRRSSNSITADSVGIEELTLASFSRIPHLETFSIRSVGITDEGVKQLAAAPRLRSLQIISLDGSLTDATLHYFAQQQLPATIILHSQSFSDEALQNFRQKLLQSSASR